MIFSSMDEEKFGYSRISMWKLPPAKIQLNVCQMVARDEKLVYAKLQPPKSRFEGMREKIKKNSPCNYFFLTLHKNL